MSERPDTQRPDPQPPDTERPDAGTAEPGTEPAAATASTPHAAPDAPADPGAAPGDDDHPTTADTLETTMSDEHGTDERAGRPDPSLSTQLGWPDVTAPVPTQATSALPEAESSTPFRVEPSTPVPDDATRPDEATDTADGLPHLPPPAGPTTSSYPGYAGYPPPTTAPSGEPSRPLVTVRRGPRPGTVVLGLLAMLVSAYVLIGNLTDADLSLRLVGPPLIGAFGGVLLLVGLVGVVAGRLRTRR